MPPRWGATPADIERAAHQFLDRIDGLDLNGIIVYDVQDESDRTSAPRPFPFAPTIDTRVFAQVLARQCALPMIVYKCIGQMNEAQWAQWLAESAMLYGVRHLSLVGRASQNSGDETVISLARATQMASAAGFSVGGVAIAERHSAARSESQRIIAKTRDGCSLFVTQAVYDADATIAMLRAYRRDCCAQELTPQRIVLTFTPCGSAKTLEFLRWLGVAIDERSARALLDAAAPLEKSIELCVDALQKILDDGSGKYLPLGINVENVSSKKSEAEGANRLLAALTNLLP